jgi:hypothetical protein
MTADANPNRCAKSITSRSFIAFVPLDALMMPRSVRCGVWRSQPKGLTGSRPRRFVFGHHHIASHAKTVRPAGVSSSSLMEAGERSHIVAPSTVGLRKSAVTVGVDDGRWHACGGSSALRDFVKLAGAVHGFATSAPPSLPWRNCSDSQKQTGSAFAPPPLMKPLSKNTYD